MIFVLAKSAVLVESRKKQSNFLIQLSILHTGSSECRVQSRAARKFHIFVLLVMLMLSGNMSTKRVEAIINTKYFFINYMSK